MKFAETKEEQIQYVENDINRLEGEYNNYKRWNKYSAIGALLCCISAAVLIIVQFKVFDADSGFNAFIIICLVISTIVLTIAAIICYINQTGYPENISARKAALDLMKNDYEKYIERQNHELIHAIKQMPTTTDNEIHSPRCPICGSYDLLPITPMQKAGKVFLWGVYAVGDMSKTWKCNSCGSKF